MKGRYNRRDSGPFSLGAEAAFRDEHRVIQAKLARSRKPRRVGHV